MSGFTAYEFFAGGGMARLGLGPDWRVVFANDFDAKKCAAYRANFGDGDLREGDIHALTTADLPGRADLAWASFPCQDLSLAGARGGFGGRRSAAFWGFWRLMQGLRAEGRAPRLLAIENVVGFASSRGGADLAAALSALADGGYRFDVRIIDAAAFLPQSRPRLFIIAWDATAVAQLSAGDGDPMLSKHLAKLPGAAKASLFPLNLPAPPLANADIAAIVEPDAPVLSETETARLVAMMAPPQHAKLEAAKTRAASLGAPVYGAAFRRMRAKEQRVEIRFDRAGCLRTPSGGSSRQLLFAVHPDRQTAARWMTGREAARLMGLPDGYILPKSETQALKLAGDGVAVPVVRWLAETALAPLLNRSLEPAAAAE